MGEYFKPHTTLQEKDSIKWNALDADGTSFEDQV
jgi:hypothetical protein